MRKLYSSDIIIQGKVSEKRALKLLAMNQEKKRKTPNVMETRCGCEAHIVIKLCSDKKYRISSMVEEHSHDKLARCGCEAHIVVKLWCFW